MGKKIVNPFTSKKKSIIDTIIPKKKEVKEKPPVVEEKSTYTKPGDPYTIKSKLINCTPVIPTFYKLYREDIDSDPRLFDSDDNYMDMYSIYINNKKEIDKRFSKYINIIIGMKVEIDTTQIENTYKIVNNINRFISDWSSYYKDPDHSVFIYKTFKDGPIEEINLLIYGSLEYFKYYYRTLYEDNIIATEMISAIASSKEIYKSIIFDESTIPGNIDKVNDMFTLEKIQTKLDSTEYDTTMHYDDNCIIYLDDPKYVEEQLNEFFGENYDIYFDKINHIYNVCNILLRVEDEEELYRFTQMKLYEFLYRFFVSEDLSSKDKEILSRIKSYLESYTDFNIKLFDKYSMLPRFFKDMASYDDVDEVVEEEEIL